MIGTLEEEEEQEQPKLYTPPPPAKPADTDAYDQMIQAGIAQNKLRSQAMLQKAEPITADAATEAAQIAARYCLPVAVVSAQLDMYRHRASIDRTVERMSGRPVLGEWMAYDEHRAAIVREDADRMSVLDDTFTVGRRAFRTVPGLAASGINSIGTGFWGLVQGAAETYEELNKANADVEQQLYAMTTGDDGQQQVLDSTGQARRTPAPIEHRLAYFAEGMRLASASLRDKLVGEQIKEAGALEQAIYGGLESASQSLTLAALTAATGGGALLAAGAMGGVAGGSAYGQAADQGLRGWRGGLFGAAQGTIEVVTEYLPAARLFEGWAKKLPVAKLLANQFAPELAGEEIATALQDLAEHFALPENKDQTLVDYLKERPSAAVLTAVSVAAALGGQGAGTMATRYLMDKIGQQTADTKTYAQDPALIKDYVERATKDTDLEQVRLPIESWNEYWTGKGVDPKAKATEITGSETAYDDAMLSGTPLMVSMGTYASQLAVDHGAFFNKEVKLLTGGELQLNEREMDEVTTDLEAHLAQAATVNEEPSVRETFSRQLQQELVAAGYTQEQATVQASFVAGIMDAVTKTSGVNAYGRSLLTVQEEQPGEAIAPAAQAQAQRPAVTNSAAFKNWFGDWTDPNAHSSKRDPNATPVSRFVNKDGTPRVYYHGTRGAHSTLEAGRPTLSSNVFGSYETARHAIFLAETPEHADAFTSSGGDSRGGNILPVYVRGNATLELANGIPEDVIEELAATGEISPGWLRQNLGHWSMFDDEGGEAFTAALRKAGFDSVEFNDTNPDTGDDVTTLAVLEPSQVKSAIANQTFDPASESVLQQMPAIKTSVPTSVDDAAALDTIVPDSKGAGATVRRELKVWAQERVLAAAKAAGVTLDPESEDIQQYLVRVAERDTMQALKSNANAVGWYDRTVAEALSVLALIHPEIATDPRAKFAFTYVLAVTSNGLKVRQNFKLAMRAYDSYKRTGKMPTNIGEGKAKNQINQSLELFNVQVAEGGQGIDSFSDMLMQQWTVKQLKKLGYEVSGEFVDTTVLGAAVLGPKVGNGFFANLNGFFDQLTIDRWLMRTWGRWNGTLITDRPDLVAKKSAEVNAAIAQLKKRSPKALAEMSDIIGIDLSKNYDVEAVGKAVRKGSEKPALRERMNKTVAGETLRKAGNLLAVYLDGQKEAPKGPTERGQMRAVLGQVLARLRDNGYDQMTMADLQAVLWYAERRFYDAGTTTEEVEEGYEDEEAPDYSNAAVEVAREEGIDDAAITAAKEASHVDAGRTGRSGGGPTDGRAGGVRPGAGGRGAAATVAGGSATGEERTLRQQPADAEVTSYDQLLADVQKPDGGFTYDANAGIKKTTGFALSMFNGRERVLDADQVTVQALAEYVVDNSDLFDVEGNHFGAWHNPEDGKVYLDVSRVVDTAEEAEQLGRANDQLAYFILHEGRSVPIAPAAEGESDGTAGTIPTPEGATFAGGSDQARADIDGAGADAAGDRGGAEGALAAQGIRGEIRYPSLITEEGRRQFTVVLTKKRDLTTFLHEVGHFLHATLADVASRPEATPQIKADKAVLDEWVGVTPGQGDYTKLQLERFARGFEAFLMEGKAPTPKLEGAFATMRGWLVDAYKSLVGLEVDAGFQVQLTDEVRAVLTRLVAADAAVSNAQLEAGHLPMFQTADAAGMTEEQFAKYRDDNILTSERAKTEVGQRLIEEERREATKAWHAERDQLRARIRDEVYAQPIYQTMAAMQNGTTPDGTPLTEGEEPQPMRLDLDSLTDTYSDIEVASLKRRRFTTTTEGSSPEMLADFFGFTSGDALVQTLLSTPPADTVINERADQEMRRRHGDLTHDPSQLRVAASEAVQSEERERVIMDELRALADMANAEALAAAQSDVPRGAEQQAQTGEVALQQEPATPEGQPPTPGPDATPGQPAAAEPAATAKKEPVRRVPGFVPREKLRHAQKERAYEARLKEAETKLRIAFAEGYKQVEIDKLQAQVRDLKASLAQGKKERDYERRWLAAEADLRARIAAGESKAKLDVLRKEVARLKRLSVTGGAVIRRGVPSIKQLRTYAQWRVGTIPIKELRPSVYLQAAAFASRRATELAAQHRFDEAIKAKTSELTSMQLYQQAVLVQRDVDKRIRYARGLSERAGRERIGKAGGTYLDQIDGILDRFDFARVSQKTLDRRSSLKEWVAKIQAQGLPVELPEEVMNEAFKKNFSELTYDELRGVTDGLRGITNLAGLKNRLLASKDKREFDEIVADAVAHMEKFGKVRKQKLGFDPVDGKFRALAEGFAAHRKMSEILQALDGYIDGGPMMTAMMVPLNNAANQEQEQFSKAGENWNALIAKHYGAWRKAGLREKVFIPEIGESLSREWILSIGLNSGNAENRHRLENDPKRQWSAAQVEAIRGHLTKADWDFIQDTWDMIDAYWPEIVAKQKRINGVAPEKVQALEVETKFGTYRGGYYPIVYDARIDEQAAQDAPITEAKLATAAAYISTTTARGHLEKRKEGVKRSMRFDLGVVPGHLQQVIHDLTHHEALIDVSRLLRNPEIRKTIQQRKGDIVLKQLTNALQAVAEGNSVVGSPLDAAASWMRSGSQMAGLGWNFWTAAQQPLGLFNGMARVGPKWVALGVGKWMKNAATMDETVKWIAERSLLMKNRMDTSQQDIHELKKQLSVSGGWFDNMVRRVSKDHWGQQNILDSYMWHIGLMQRVADIPVWLGQYEKSMASGVDEAVAIQHADQAVLDSQGGGQVKDLAAVQRGPAIAKLFMTFYSYGNTVFNATAREVGKFNQTRTPAGAARMLGNLSLIYIMPAIVSVTLKRALGGGDDDDETWAEWFATVGAEVASSAMNTMVLVRELAGLVKEGNRGYGGPAGTRLLSQIYQAANQVKQGEADEAFWRSMNSLAGILVGFPSAQVERSVEGWWALEEGKTKNPFALVMGAPKE